jgi:hypothetical protein
VFNLIVNQVETKGKYISVSTVHSISAVELSCLILIVMHCAYDRSRSRGAGVGDPIGASPWGVSGPQASSFEEY